MVIEIGKNLSDFLTVVVAVVGIIFVVKYLTRVV
jgi:hypothetical protein